MSPTPVADARAVPVPDVMSKGRGRLLVIWFAGFALSLAIVLLLYARGWIHSSTLQAAAKGLNEIYAPYLGAITLYYWGTRKAPSSGAHAPAAAGRLAVGLSVAWNLLVLSFLVPVAFGAGAIEQALENITTVAGVFSWLAAGAIGFYFASAASGGEG